MGSWPFTRLHFGSGRCIAISGPHIQVLDVTSGQIQHATRCASVVSCSAVDERCTHLVTTGNDKKLNVWDLDSLELKSSRELPKKATMIQLSHDGQTIVVADKFGDVFSYPLIPPTNNSATSQAAEQKSRDLQAAHENPHGILVLGHASIITSFLLSHDGRHIITADRDEHIRVSRYPQGYIIERYCLGHELFVSAVCLPAFEPSSLVSGGGDPSLRIWDWMAGTLKCEIPVADAVKPFLKVRATRQKWHGSLEGNASGTRGRKGRGRGKKLKKTPGEAAMETEQPLPLSSEAVTVAATSETDLVFALAKLEAFQFDDERLLVFTAVGGSALFYCTYPSPASHIPSVRQLDLSRPILDFVLGYKCQVLVSVDTAWTSPENREDQSNKAAIRLIAWQNGEFKPVEEASPLLTSLNGAASREASPAELVSLDLYSDLALLPKHAQGPEEGDGIGDQDSDMRADTPEGSQGDGKKATGRLKTKQALLRRQELDQGSSRSVSGDERESKKIKLDTNE